MIVCTVELGGVVDAPLFPCHKPVLSPEPEKKPVVFSAEYGDVGPLHVIPDPTRAEPERIRSSLFCASAASVVTFNEVSLAPARKTPLVLFASIGEVVLRPVKQAISVVSVAPLLHDHVGW